MMSRRSLIAALLVSSFARAGKSDVSVFGDSHCGQLAPRLIRAASSRGRHVRYKHKPGSSTLQWLREGLFRDALSERPADVVLISLGTNCVRQERARLADDMAALVAIAKGRGVRPIWLMSPTRKFPTDYIAAALASVDVEVIWPGRLQLEADRVHCTDFGLRVWAAQITRELWG